MGTRDFIEVEDDDYEEHWEMLVNGLLDQELSFSEEALARTEEEALRALEEAGAFPVVEKDSFRDPDF